MLCSKLASDYLLIAAASVAFLDRMPAVAHRMDRMLIAQVPPVQGLETEMLLVGNTAPAPYNPADNRDMARWQAGPRGSALVVAGA